MKKKALGCFKWSQKFFINLQILRFICNSLQVIIFYRSKLAKLLHRSMQRQYYNTKNV